MILTVLFSNLGTRHSLQIAKTRDRKFESTLIEDVAKIGKRSDTNVVPELKIVNVVKILK